MRTPLLSVSDLRVRFHTDRGVVRALDGVNFAVEPGETLCLVGESGSGKTVACESLTRLVPTPPAELDGEVRFDGQNLLSASDRQLRAVRGDRIAYVFQNPQGALDPVYTVGDQLVEAIRIHRDVSKSKARRRAIRLLDRVGIPDPAERIDEYPHEFSGGMKQRVVIATALAADPDLLVADEPTTALDVTTQAEILRLLRDVQQERGMAVLFVTHDLGVVAQVADRVVVMYAGKVMERGGVESIFDRPAHPYTRALFDCLPRHDREPRPIPGSFPDPTDPPAGCRFHPRCPDAIEDCRAGDHPPQEVVGGDRSSENGRGGGTGDDHAGEDGRADETADVNEATHEAACIYYDGDHDSAALGDEYESDGSEVETTSDEEARR